MLEFIANPRRSPRTPARCRARIVSGTASFEASTEDVGRHGCQVIAPRLVRAGEALRVTLSDARVREPLVAAGRIAWASARSPWRIGIAFDEERLGASARFVSDLLQAYPALTPAPRIPDRIPLDTAVYLAAPPRLVVDFTRDEVDLLRAVASGARVDELLARFRDRWPAIQTALYSLLARQHLTLSRGAAVLPETWRKLLAGLEGALAAAELEDAGGPTAPGWARAATPPPLPAPPPPLARTRGAEAQACLDRALAEAGRGHPAAAVGLLRRALALAPGDAEIADALGHLAFTGRPPTR